MSVITCDRIAAIKQIFAQGLIDAKTSDLALKNGRQWNAVQEHELSASAVKGPACQQIVQIFACKTIQVSCVCVVTRMFVTCITALLPPIEDDASWTDHQSKLLRDKIAVREKIQRT